MEAWKEELYSYYVPVGSIGSNYNELEHHGILGQKWGIRRYQNADGSYTKEGLRRYNVVKEKYDKSSNDLKTIRMKYKSGEVSKEDLTNAKKKNKDLKKSLKQHYKQLERDKRADKGKELYSSGKTVTNERIKAYVAAALSEIGTVVAGSIVGSAIESSGMTLTNKVVGTLGPSTLSQIAQMGIDTVGTAATLGYIAKKGVNERNIRSYYTHNRPSMPK